MNKYVFIWFLVSVHGNVIKDISRQRTMRGITPLFESPSLKETLKESILNGLEGSISQGEDIFIFSVPNHNNTYILMDEIKAKEENMNIIFNRQSHACVPFKSAASVVNQDNLYIALSSDGPLPVAGYRPVDFPDKSCTVEGMEAYLAPLSYTQEVRDLYNQINFDLVQKDIKPFMFSNILSSNSNSSLLCSSFKDPACLDSIIISYPPYLTYQLTFPLSSNNYETILNSKEYQTIRLIHPEDSWQHWQAIGIAMNETHFDINFATDDLNWAGLNNGICPEPCLRN